MQLFTGLEYLKIDIANQAGKDKVSFEERIAWVDEYESDLEDLVDIAKKPFQYCAAVMAYRDAQRGIPTGHMVGVDAAASGLQIMAALTGCRITARNTGLIGSVCSDIYSICTKEMSMLLGAEVNVPRKQVKSAQMPYFYGSKQKPKDVFGDGTEEFYAFHQANKNVAPGACELLELFLSSWQPYALHHSWVLPDGFNVYVPVMVQVDTRIEIDELDHASFSYLHAVNQGTEKGLSIAANTVHSVDGMVVREICRRCNYDRRQLEGIKHTIEFYLNQRNDFYETMTTPLIESLAMESGFVSLVGIEYINDVSIFEFGTEYLQKLLALINTTLTRKSFPVVTIHDEFKAHPNNLNVVRQTYIDIMAEIAESDMLSFMLTQIRPDYVEIEKYTPDLADHIRQGNYAIS